MQERCKFKLIISLLHGCPFRLPSHVFSAPYPALPGDGLPEGSRSQPTAPRVRCRLRPGEQPVAPGTMAGNPGGAWGRPRTGVGAGKGCEYPRGRGGIRAPCGCSAAGAGEGSEQVTRRLLRARLLELLRGSSAHGSHRSRGKGGEKKSEKLLGARAEPCFVTVRIVIIIWGTRGSFVLNPSLPALPTPRCYERRADFISTIQYTLSREHCSDKQLPIPDDYKIRFMFPSERDRIS